jgi:hypothetical protein
MKNRWCGSENEEPEQQVLRLFISLDIPEAGTLSRFGVR